MRLRLENRTWENRTWKCGVFGGIFGSLSDLPCFLSPTLTLIRTVLIRLFIISMVGIITSTGSWAQSNVFPEHAHQGLLSSSAYPSIVINGIQRDTSPNLQIRDKKNLIIVQSALSGGDVNVLYRENNQGQVERIWMLTQEQADHYQWQKEHNALRN